MKDLLTILDAAQKIIQSGQDAALVTLVKTQGSAYRRPGARMLVLPGCRTIGTISGGCLEPAVARQAWAATRNHHRALLTFQSAPEDELWSPTSASGCHRQLFLLAEPLPAALPTLRLLKELLESETGGTIAHEFSLPENENPPPINSPKNPSKSSQILAKNKKITRFLEQIPPIPHLLICGAGDDAQPLARLAAILGWRIDILDSRARLATHNRFPDARSVSSDGPPAVPKFARQNTSLVIMSHRFTDDADYLANLPPNTANYLGILGPRRRTERLLAQLADRGFSLTQPQFAQLFSPVGLDIGSAEPETIALAIIAQIQAVLTQRDGQHLSLKPGPINAYETRTPCPL